MPPIQDLPAFVHKFLFGTIDLLFDTATRVKERLAVPGKPVTYPIDWDSDKQRRFVMAKLRAEGGPPYVRKGGYDLAFRVERYEYGARLFAPYPFGAVVGLASGWQSRIHRNRWAHTITVLFEELAKIPQEISNKFSVRSK